MAKNSSQISLNENAPNATKMIVLEFVNGMGRALQQLLSANSMNVISTNKQESTVHFFKLNFENNWFKLNIIFIIYICEVLKINSINRIIVRRRSISQYNSKNR